MLAHGFPVGLLVKLTAAGLATAYAERMMVGGPPDGDHPGGFTYGRFAEPLLAACSGSNRVEDLVPAWANMPPRPTPQYAARKNHLEGHSKPVARAQEEPRIKRLRDCKRWRNPWIEAFTKNDALRSAAVEGIGWATDSFTYTMQLGNGALSTATVTLRINGVDDLAVISGDDTGSVREDFDLTDTGTLSISDPDTGQVASFIAHDNSNPLAGEHGTLIIDADGNWIYTRSTTWIFEFRH